MGLGDAVFVVPAAAARFTGQTGGWTGRPQEGSPAKAVSLDTQIDELIN